MKSFLVIAADPSDLETLEAAWRSRPGVSAGDTDLQWFESGFLFNVDTEEDVDQERSWREGWKEGESVDFDPPDGARSWYVECRSEEVVARIMREAAGMVEGPLWVLDELDVVWPADAIDPARIVL